MRFDRIRGVDMTVEEINKCLDVYENYIKELIRLDGNNPNIYHCSTRTIKKQTDNYVIGNLWPRCNPYSGECERWQRVPNLDSVPDGVVYIYAWDGKYIINAFCPKWKDSVVIIRYSY